MEIASPPFTRAWLLRSLKVRRMSAMSASVTTVSAAAFTGKS